MLAPRVVTVSRRSELDELLARHGTRAAAEFFLRQRGRDLAEVQDRHDALAAALAGVGSAVPPDWRRGHVDRSDLPRFLFAPEDIVIAVGQDGLVANVAKYLDGQLVIGVNPEPQRNPGVLVRHAPHAVAGLLRGQPTVERRTMVVAELDDGQQLHGLNDIYIGHPGHQSSRYTVAGADRVPERQSSSGLVIGTGSGATGWCASIVGSRPAGQVPEVPGACEATVCWFVREAWPSPATGVSLTSGRLVADERLELVSESEQLVVFADGLEADRLELSWGQRVTIGVAARYLALVGPAAPAVRTRSLRPGW